MEAEWRAALEKREAERRVREAEWRERLESLERERAARDIAWRQVRPLACRQPLDGLDTPSLACCCDHILLVLYSCLLNTRIWPHKSAVIVIGHHMSCNGGQPPSTSLPPWQHLSACASYRWSRRELRKRRSGAHAGTSSSPPSYLA